MLLRKHAWLTALQPILTSTSSPVLSVALCFMHIKPCFSSHERSTQFPFCKRRSTIQGIQEYSYILQRQHTPRVYCYWVWCNILRKSSHAAHVLHHSTYLSCDQYTVFCISGHGRFSKSPASKADRGVITPVKQPLCPDVVKSDPKFIIRCCRLWEHVWPTHGI